MAQILFTNENPGQQSIGTVVRVGSTPGYCLLAAADTSAHYANLLGIRLDDVASGATGTLAPIEPGAEVLMVAAPNLNDVIYLTVDGTGRGTVVSSPVKLGVCCSVRSSGGVFYASLINPYSEGAGSTTSKFVSPVAIELHVGSVPDCYLTMESALTALGLLPPGNYNIIVHSGTYTPLSGPWQIPANTAIYGEGNVAFYSTTTDLFSVMGDGVSFNNFHVLGQSNTAIAAMRFNNHSYVNVDRVGMWSSGPSTQQFIAQSGNSWHQHSITNCFYDSAVSGTYTISFINTSGTPRWVDVEIEALFGDSWAAGVNGGGFYLQDVQDFRFKNNKIRTSAGSCGIRLVGSGSWIEIDTTTSVLQGGSYGDLLRADAGTTARWAYVDGTYTSAGTIVQVGLIGPPGPPGVPGAPGPSAGLTTAIDLDFSTQTPATYATDGVKTIAGIAAFRLNNSAHGQLIALNDGTHSGLYTRCNSFNSVNYGTSENGPRWTIGIQDLCGVSQKDATEQWLFYMFAQPHTPNANYEYAYFGLGMLPGADSDTGHQHPVVELARGYSSGLVTIVEWQLGSTVTQNPTGATLPLTTDNVYVFRVVANSFVEVYSATSVGTTWPTIANLKFVSRVSYWAVTQGFPTSVDFSVQNFQWAFVCQIAQSNTVGASDMLLNKIMVMYR